jgi:hypothetical protein
VPHIRAELNARGYLNLLRSFGCSAAMLTATVDDVDRIVSDGIRIGALRLES